MLSRRNFIKDAGICSAGLILSSSSLIERPAPGLGLQMYTVREVIDKNVAGTIARIAKIGYKKLEIGSYTNDKKYWGFEPKPFRQLLDQNGLTAPSGHFGFEQFFTDGSTEDIKPVLTAAKIVGQEYITVSYLGEHFRKNTDDYKRIADKLNIAGKLCREAGLQLAYHNHDFEFEKKEDGKAGFDILLNQTDNSLVQFELDLFWAVKAGNDPLQLFEANPGRFPMWHIKDLDKATQSFTEVGSGMIDFKRIFAKQKEAGMNHLFIEQDKISKDVFESIGQSFRYVTTKIL